MKPINLLIVPFILLTLGCSTAIKNKKVLGKTFPTVEGTALSGQKWSFPKDIEGKKTILLVAYVQDSQFDVDRWLIGLDSKKVKAPFFEVPTIKGLLPRMFEKQIDSGMRKGIPESLWAGVVTIYKDGAKVVEFTGNTNPRNTRVFVLDKQGKIIYFHDKGFSVPALNALIEKL